MMSETLCFPAPAQEDSSGPLSFSLEVRGGRTGFRRRPILGDRFLIGSDSICDLQLDSRIAAPLHCLLRRDGDGLEAEPLTGAMITINGVDLSHGELAAGDTLGVGPVRLLVHSHWIRFDVVRPTDDVAEPHFAAVDGGAAAAQRTASQLVDLIEAEEDRLREFDDRRRAGAAALLDALRRTKSPVPEALAEEPTTQIDALVARFDRLATALERQATRRPASHGDVCDAADSLLEAQRELVGQADRLLRLAAAIADASRTAPRRVA